eukprot:CAMPEP_0115107542 /NCGR_PEP_ID=MMETSP0227-20121206/37382_1 /TAXON_ID=89957 /ORGANISM="Polarella glacialis, Strain CCMP 1383" /LENGTH=117 /DNA_ID=CAMNT_0002505489 /DNA_START=156 /DNA_END=511 /DNA_ORIENTATION=-
MGELGAPAAAAPAPQLSQTACEVELHTADKAALALNYLQFKLGLRFRPYQSSATLATMAGLSWDQIMLLGGSCKQRSIALADEFEDAEDEDSWHSCITPERPLSPGLRCSFVQNPDM